MIYIVRHWYCGKVEKIFPDAKPWAVEYKKEVGTKKEPKWETVSEDVTVIEAESIDEVIEKYKLPSILIWTPRKDKYVDYPHWTIWVTDGELKFGQK